MPHDDIERLKELTSLLTEWEPGMTEKEICEVILELILPHLPLSSERLHLIPYLTERGYTVLK